MNDRWHKPITPLVTPITALGWLLMVAAFCFALGCVTSSTWQERPEMPMVVGR
jgi:hypothetical protein